MEATLTCPHPKPDAHTEIFTFTFKNPTQKTTQSSMTRYIRTFVWIKEIRAPLIFHVTTEGCHRHTTVVTMCG